MTSDSKHNLPVAPNILNREFTANAPGIVRVNDITYIPTDEGWLYLAGIKDLFNDELLGYVMNERMARHLVNKLCFVQQQINIWHDRFHESQGRLL